MSCWVQTHSFSFSPLPFSVLTPNNTLLAEAFLPSHSLSLSLPPSISGGREQKKILQLCHPPHSRLHTGKQRASAFSKESVNENSFKLPMCWYVALWGCLSVTRTGVYACGCASLPPSLIACVLADEVQRMWKWREKWVYLWGGGAYYSKTQTLTAKPSESYLKIFGPLIKTLFWKCFRLVD